MEFYAQELWIFLIYNVRGSLLSCLLLRLTGPRPHAHSLCLLHPCPPALAVQHVLPLWPLPAHPFWHCWALGPRVDRNDPIALVSELTVASLGRWLPPCSQIQVLVLPSALRPALCTDPTLCSHILPPFTRQSQKQGQLPFWGRRWGIGVCENRLPEKHKLLLVL